MQPRTRSIAFVTLTAAGLLLFPAAATAACSTRDLAGNWSVSLAQLSASGALVSQCDMSVSAQGRISGTCVNRVPRLVWRGQLAGTGRVNRSCAVGGRVGQDGLRGTIQARVSASKEVVTGIISHPDVVSQFTAVKR